MNKISYRWSKVTDLPALFAIDQTIWNATNTPVPMIDTTLEDYVDRYPVGSQLVAVQGNQVVGMISWNALPPYPAFNQTWDIGIGVAQTAQHQGIGQGLMTALKAAAREQHIHRIQLQVLGTNWSARQFYAQQGFQVEGVAREAFWLQGQFVDDYRLAYLV
ncbi:GNAT family N-acetyltransferase [Lactiplantibacillus mudanjiangensis]|uniref:N-acetyltransferase domain-containing protein n=1 Tax=Lactiplantibacillus mudanjiangensis TaxID=1296538 RepID=A0A660DUP4_9LACO|nr:GNAT family N-acetyltransferase [Lactiplantibacillus mudanjiangensis]VDG22797.1 hypothetical protein [Lactobacillus sp. CBA3605] [Lactiplantibacillus mudanjiangensis]VDG26633.1 hypothetical protein [Lactobacillus sp. CBA3605] [Lactiplantibacillus mudanjiangensis]